MNRNGDDDHAGNVDNFTGFLDEYDCKYHSTHCKVCCPAIHEVYNEMHNCGTRETRSPLVLLSGIPHRAPEDNRPNGAKALKNSVAY